MRDPIWQMDQLLAPVAWREFVDDYWQEEPLHSTALRPDGLAHLASVHEVDHLLGEYGGRSDFALSVIGSRIDTGVPKHLRSSDRSHWTPERVYERLGLGATVRIGNVGRHIAAVGRLSSVFEAAFQTDINVNLYYTPRGARAFEAHSDNHDVFILQVEGSKCWNLYRQAERWPIEVMHRGRLEWLRAAGAGGGGGGGYAPPADTSQLTREIVLEAGDVLYVPRGLVHRVLTTDDRPSLHLTVAVPVVTWYEASVVALLTALQSSPELRRALPVDFATAPEKISDQELSRVREAVATHLDEGALREAIATMGRQFVDSRRGHWHGATRDIEAVGEIGLDTRLARRPAVLVRVDRHPTQLVLSFWGRQVPVPIRCESMLEPVLAGEPFTPRTLPTHLNDESRLVFSRALVQHGLVGLADE